jgi:multidrug transporter EmrE-like cation transporter
MKTQLVSSLGLILLSVASGVGGQLAIKVGVTRAGAAAVEVAGPVSTLITAFRSPLVWLGLALYGLGALAWILVLTRLNLSLAYPFLALNFVLIAVASRVFLGESIPVIRWAGIAVICVGIFLIARSAR